MVHSVGRPILPMFPLCEVLTGSTDTISVVVHICSLQDVSIRNLNKFNSECKKHHKTGLRVIYVKKLNLE